MSKLFGLAMIVVVALTAAGAAQAKTDPRIREIAYDRGQVVRLVGAYGRQMMIEFAPGEHIENVAVGDVSRWMVNPNKRAELLFVKSLFPTGRSNMTVVTDRRRYIFDLIAASPSSPELIYNLRFRFTAEELADPTPPAIALTQTPAPDKAATPAPRNTRYSFSGPVALAPRRVFDDGKSTWLQWADGETFPAVFAVGAGGQEDLVNGSVRDGYLVVDRIARAFMLRSGQVATQLFNDAYAEPALDDEAPRPRREGPAPAATPARRHGLGGLFGARSKP